MTYVRKKTRCLAVCLSYMWSNLVSCEGEAGGAREALEARLVVCVFLGNDALGGVRGLERT